MILNFHRTVKENFSTVFNKEKYVPISLMNTDFVWKNISKTKFSNKLKTMYHDQIEFNSEIQGWCHIQIPINAIHHIKRITDKMI